MKASIALSIALNVVGLTLLIFGTSYTIESRTIKVSENVMIHYDDVPDRFYRPIFSPPSGLDVLAPTPDYSLNYVGAALAVIGLSSFIFARRMKGECAAD